MYPADKTVRTTGKPVACTAPKRGNYRQYPLHQKFLDPYLYFRFACLSNIIRLLFPLRYPMNCAILR